MNLSKIEGNSHIPTHPTMQNVNSGYPYHIITPYSQSLHPNNPAPRKAEDVSVPSKPAIVIDMSEYTVSETELFTLPARIKKRKVSYYSSQNKETNKLEINSYFECSVKMERIVGL